MTYKLTVEKFEACIVAMGLGTMVLPKVKHGVLGDLKIGLLVIKAAIEGSLATEKSTFH